MGEEKANINGIHGLGSCQYGELLRRQTVARNLLLGMSMDFQIDLDPTHLVLRATITAAVLTEELAEDYYQAISLVASSGGPYAGIYDFSGVTRTTLSANAVRGFASRPYPIPPPRHRVLVAKEPVIFGLARMLQLLQDVWGEHFQVVRSLEEAYEMLGVRPEDFTQRLFPKDRAA
jgi:hypothetical protein